MSRLREYRFDPDTKTMKPAWSEKNEEWGPVRAAGTRGEMVVGVSSKTLELMRDRRKREAA